MGGGDANLLGISRHVQNQWRLREIAPPPQWPRPPQPASANQSQPLADHDMSMNDGDQSQPLADHVNERDDERGRACFVWCLFPIR